MQGIFKKKIQILYNLDVQRSTPLADVEGNITKY